MTRVELRDELVRIQSLATTEHTHFFMAGAVGAVIRHLDAEENLVEQLEKGVQQAEEDPKNYGYSKKALASALAYFNHDSDSPYPLDKVIGHAVAYWKSNKHGERDFMRPFLKLMLDKEKE